MSYLDELFSVAGKTAVVTGAATGIGRMAATALSQAGARVLIASRKGDACKAVAEEINARGGGKVEGFAGDVSTEDGVAQLVRDIGERTDTLHILFNNAGITWGEPFATFPYKAWEKVFSVNVAAIFQLTRDLLPLLDRGASASDPARVINLGSVMGTQPIADGAWSYTASKAAVHHLTRTLALELAPRHVTVNAFAPGPFPSRMMDFAVGTQEKAAHVGARVPIGRIGSPDDIAGATLYLCSRAGGFVTGAILPIDGGQSVQHGMSLWED